MFKRDHFNNVWAVAFLHPNIQNDRFKSFIFTTHFKHLVLAVSEKNQQRWRRKRVANMVKDTCQQPEHQKLGKYVYFVLWFMFMVSLALIAQYRVNKYLADYSQVGYHIVEGCSVVVLLSCIFMYCADLLFFIAIDCRADVLIMWSVFTSTVSNLQ